MEPPQIADAIGSSGSAEPGIAHNHYMKNQNSLVNLVNARLVDELYQSALTSRPGSYRSDALNRLCRFLGLSGAIWRRRRTHQPPHSVTSVGIPAAAPASLFRSQDQNPAHASAYGEPGIAVALDRLLPASSINSSALMTRVLKPLNVAHLAMIVWREPRSGLDTELSLLRASGQAPFSDDELRLTEWIMPFLVGAARHATFLAAACPSADHWDRAAAIVDLGGNIMEAQPAFLDLVDAHYPNWRGSQLPFEVPSADTRSGQRLDKLCLYVEPLGELTRVRIWPRQAITELTDRERTVASAIAEGLSYKETAKRLGISASTVSNHLQKVYDKLNLKSRAELTRFWRQLAPTTVGASPATSTTR